MEEEILEIKKNTQGSYMRAIPSKWLSFIGFTSEELQGKQVYVKIIFDNNRITIEKFAAEVTLVPVVKPRVINPAPPKEGSG